MVELLITVAIVAVLAAVIASVGNSLVSRSHAINCAKNLRQIGMASMLYAGDNQMTLPQSMHQKSTGVQSWRVSLQPYAAGTITFRCKQDPVPARPNTYVLNDFLTAKPSGAPSDFNFSILAKIDRPEDTLMFAEASTSYLSADHFHFAQYYGQKFPASAFAAQVAVEAHGSGGNYLFADGHVETLPWTDVQSRLRKPGSRFLNPVGN